MTNDIAVSLLDGVLTVTLTRPQKKNALTDEMYRVLADSLEQAQSDSAVRAVVLRGEGDLFCAGNDLGDFANSGEEQETESVEEKNVGRFIRALIDCETPIVAAVRGKAVGVGTTMLLHCDVVLMTDDAQLTTPFVNLAVVPEAGSSALLVERIGHVRAFAMFVLGAPLDAPSCVAAGIANTIVPADELHSTAARLAQTLAAKPAGALAATKRLMRRQEALHQQVAQESALFSERLASAEAQEAFAAFAQKRKPDFTQFA